jgi:hypothetical protein
MSVSLNMMRHRGTSHPFATGGLCSNALSSEIRPRSPLRCLMRSTISFSVSEVKFGGSGTYGRRMFTIGDVWEVPGLIDFSRSLLILNFSND